MPVLKSKRKSKNLSEKIFLKYIYLINLLMYIKCVHILHAPWFSNAKKMHVMFESVPHINIMLIIYWTFFKL